MKKKQSEISDNLQLPCASKNPVCMELSVINIGNAKGIRLTDAILKEYGIRDKIELILEKDFMILKPKAQPRKGWAKAFREMHKNGDDKLLMDDVFADEDFEEL